MNWTLSANYNRVSVRNIVDTPAPIAASGQALFDRAAVSTLEDMNPRYKVIAGLNWSLGKFVLVARETLYGPSSALVTDGSEYVRNRIKAAAITDLELGYKLSPGVTASVGANNLFDHQPPTLRLNSSGAPSDGRVIYPSPLLFAPYGINGGYYYARLDVTF